MLPDAIVFKPVYGNRQVLFVDGRGRGDYYQAAAPDSDVWRVRLWPKYRLQGGAEQLVLSEEAARDVLLEMLAEQRQAEAG